MIMMPEGELGPIRTGRFAKSSIFDVVTPTGIEPVFSPWTDQNEQYQRRVPVLPLFLLLCKSMAYTVTGTLSNASLERMTKLREGAERAAGVHGRRGRSYEHAVSVMPGG
jgi:hypothetical protein